MPILSNPKHELFAQSLARGRSQADAYAEAGYQPSEPNASRLTRNDKVQARVAELQGKAAEKAAVDIARTLTEMGRLGFSDLRRLFDDKGGLKPVHEWDDDLAAAVSSIEVVTKTLPGRNDDAPPEIEYIHKIKLWDKNSALEKIAKHLGMFSTPGDSPDNPLHTETRTADPRPVGEIVSRFRAASMAKPNGNGAVKH